MTIALEALQNEVRDLLIGFVLEVRASIAMGRTDVSSISETFLVELLREVFELPGLRNLNSDRSNFPGVDLGDDDVGIAFQITAERSLNKIIETLNTVIARNLYATYPKIRVYVTTEKQRSYSQTSIDAITAGKILFHVEKDIFDYRDLLALFKTFELERLQRVAGILRKHLSGVATRTIREPIPHPREPAGLLKTEPLFYHPYASTKGFTGRDAERAMLTTWFANPDAPTVLVVEAIGGMGKSALVWHWVQSDLPRAALKLDGLFWWSFYESDASFDNFTDKALLYLAGAGYKADLGSERPWSYLARIVRERRCLLVLDGVERCLRAYGHTHATYQGDNFVPDTQGHFRECVSPDMQRFLIALLPPHSAARVLLTTRLTPRELDDREGCLRHDLMPMTKPDAVGYFRSRGVGEDKASSAEIDFACTRYGYNPLAITLLIGAILKDVRFLGDIRASRDLELRLIATEPGRSHEILELTYDALPRPLREFFSRIAAFRSPVDLDALQAVFEGTGLIAALRRTLHVAIDAEVRRFLVDVHVSVQELVERGLLLVDASRKRYDMHPIVRQYAYNRLTDKTGVHARLGEYFSAVQRANENEPRKLEDLTPTIELYHHMIGSGRHDQAARLFVDRLFKPLFLTLYAYNLIIELLEGLFTDSEQRQPCLLRNAENVAWVRTLLMAAYTVTGLFRAAEALLKRLVAADSAKRFKDNDDEGKRDNNSTIALELAYLSAMRHQLGDLKEAEESARQGLALSRKWGARDEIEFAYVCLIQILETVGKLDEVAREREVAASELGSRTDMTPNSQFDFANQNDAANLSATRGRELVDMLEKYNRDREVENIAALGVGKANILVEAETCLTEALENSRVTNRTVLEAQVLIDLARLRQIQGDRAEAVKLAHGSLGIAKRCQLRLHEARLHNFLARCCLEEALASADKDLRGGMLSKAREHGESGRERAWCSGPPYCYDAALKEADLLLAEISAVAGSE